MTSRPDQAGALDLAVRRQRGRSALPATLSELRDALGGDDLDLHVLPLEETDRLIARYSTGFHRCRAGETAHLHLRFPPGETGAMFSRLLQLGMALGNARVILFGRHWQDTGAVEIPADRFFPAADSLLRLEIDHLRAASTDGAQGVLIDNLLDDDPHLELWCWGPDWSKLAREEFQAGP